METILKYFRKIPVKWRFPAFAAMAFIAFFCFFTGGAFMIVLGGVFAVIVGILAYTAIIE